MSDVAATAYPILEYGADPTGTKDATGLLQAVFALAQQDGSHRVDLPPGATFLWTSPITVTGDITVFAHGATLRWGGDAGVPGFVNDVPINLAWYGGTIDGDNAFTACLFGFGASGLAPASAPLLSCVAEDLDFVNVVNSAWQCQAVDSSGTNANQHVRWRNVTGSKGSSGNSGDLFEIVGIDVDVDVTCILGNSGATAITSAFLKDAHIRCFVCDAAGQSTDDNSVLLQPYTFNGSGPYFKDVVIEANGRPGIANGNLSSPTTVSEGLITISLDDAAALALGSSSNDVWSTVEVLGSMRPPNGGGISIFAVDRVTFHSPRISLSRVTTTNFGLIFLAAGAPAGRVRVLDLELDAPSSTVEGVFNAAAGATAAALEVRGGDLTAANLSHNPLFASGTEGQWGQVAISGVAGYNPASVATPSVPPASTAVSNDTGVDCDVYIAGGTAVAVSVNGTATGQGAGTFFVPAGGTIDLGAYTTAPTWAWIGR